MQTEKSRWLDLTIFALLAGKIVLHYFLINPTYELHRDEYLHLDQANHLAWGYHSVPPFTSWVSLAIKWLGNGVFWVHLFPAAFGAITIYVAVRIVRELGGSFFAELLVVFSLIFSALLRVNMLHQPNSVDILAWTLAFFLLVKYIKTKKYTLLYLLATVTGLGFLNKYTVVFLIAGLVVGLLSTKQRRIFLNRHLYLAAGLALIIVIPNLYWQYANDWPVIHHMNELAETQLVNVSRANFLKDQLIFFFNSFFLLIAALIGFIRFPPFRPYLTILITCLVIVFILMMLRAKSYYSLGLYPAFLAFGSVYLDNFISSGWRKYSRPVFVLLIILLFVPILNVAFPVATPDEIARNGEKFKNFGLLRWEDGKDHALPQDFADMLGWKEMTAKTRLACETIPQNERKYTLIVTDNYGQAGAINYYSKKKLLALSFTNENIDWFPPIDPIKHYIVVGEISSEEDRSHFKNFRLIDSVTSPYAREKGAKISVLSYPDKAIIRKIEERFKD